LMAVFMFSPNLFAELKVICKTANACPLRCGTRENAGDFIIGCRRFIDHGLRATAKVIGAGIATRLPVT
jgi:hypothetical protein